MTEWHARTIEQRNLLNPAFCAVVVWHLSKGYRAEAAASNAALPGLPIELAFIGPSLVLRGQTRKELPGTVRTSLATWVQDHPLERSAVAKGVAVLRPYVRGALCRGRGVALRVGTVASSPVGKPSLSVHDLALGEDRVGVVADWRRDEVDAAGMMG